MQKNEIYSQSQAVLERIKANPKLGKYVDCSLEIPEVFRGSGEIKLIILGQDPTVKNPISRKHIHYALNLDPQRKGNLWNYLAEICGYLGFDLAQNIYATNLYKNFFIQPPTQIKAVDIFHEALPCWLPLLLEELAEFPLAPVITLGEPLLTALVSDLNKAKVRDYWGYVSGWQQGNCKAFSMLEPQDNILGQVIFPYPHQPSIQKRFYREHLATYAAFTKQVISSFPSLKTEGMSEA
jgi:hypothetical protein